MSDKNLGNHGTVVGTKSGSYHVLLKGGTGEIAKKKIDSSAIQSVGLPAIDASDKAASKISTVNPVPPFSFEKIDPAGKASVVFVPGARLATLFYFPCCYDAPAPPPAPSFVGLLGGITNINSIPGSSPIGGQPVVVLVPGSNSNPSPITVDEVGTRHCAFLSIGRVRANKISERPPRGGIFLCADHVAVQVFAYRTKRTLQPHL